jgi:hypothetical protein
MEYVLLLYNQLMQCSASGIIESIPEYSTPQFNESVRSQRHSLAGFIVNKLETFRSH